MTSLIPKLGSSLLGLVLIASVSGPTLAAPPTVLAQFFEHFDEGLDAPLTDEPTLEGLDLDGLGEGGLGAEPGWAPDQMPGQMPGQALGPEDQAIAGAIPPVFDPAQRAELLEGLYARLAEARSPAEAAPITEAIEELWTMSGSDTVDLLMSRATQFANDADVDLSLAVLNAILDIAPEQTEAWYLRAKVKVLAGKPEQALIDLRRALNLDEKHYRAIADLGLVLEQLGAKKEALQAYRQALAVNPYLDDAKAGVDALSREVEGQDI